MKNAVFLDRDGVINRKAPEGKYVTRWQDLEILPGVPKAIASLNHAGFRVIVASNQRCVAKGLLGEAELRELHEKLCSKLAADGAIINAVYYCPHEANSGCGCRKPAPGMLLAAARDHRIDLSRSWMIGDSASDVEAGFAAGCKTVRIVRSPEGDGGGATIVAHSLFDAVEKILGG